MLKREHLKGLVIGIAIGILCGLIEPYLTRSGLRIPYLTNLIFFVIVGIRPYLFEFTIRIIGFPQAGFLGGYVAKRKASSKALPPEGVVTKLLKKVLTLNRILMLTFIFLFILGVVGWYYLSLPLFKKPQIDFYYLFVVAPVGVVLIYRGIKGLVRRTVVTLEAKPSKPPEAATLKVEQKLIEIAGGYEPVGEHIKVGIKVSNHTDIILVDASIALTDIPEALILTEPKSPFLRLGNIMPGEFQSAIYSLKPNRCVDGDISGVLNYYDPTGKRQDIDVPPIHIRNICPFLTSEGVMVDEFTDVLKLGLLPCRRTSFHFTGSPKVALTMAEQRVRQLVPVDRDEKTVDGVYCGYACYLGNAKYGGYMFATEILVSGTETHGQLTISVYSNEEAIVTGYVSEVMEDVKQHISTTQEITVLSGKCPVCGGQIDPMDADERGLVKCRSCRCLNVIPPWMRIKKQ